MPAKSKSQQRLFGMVHAYNKGVFHGSASLRKRLASLSKHISDEDAQHFAKTPHEGLPEKTAQVFVSPDEVNRLYGQIPPGVLTAALPSRSERRRTFLGSVFRGGLVGAGLGGLGIGGLGAYLAYRVGQQNPGISSDALKEKMLQAGLRCGVWGASRGAVGGAALGGGLHILDKIRGAT